LVRLDEQKARLVELRVLGGLSIEEQQMCWGCTHDGETAMALARAWLHGEMQKK